MNEIVFKQGRGLIALYFFIDLCMVFVAANNIALAHSLIQIIIFAVCAAVLGVSVIILFIRLLKPKAVLTVSDNGFEAGLLNPRFGFVPWSNVRNISHATHTKYISVELNTEEDFNRLQLSEKTRKNLAKVNASLKLPKTNVTFVYLGARIDNAFKTMQDFWEGNKSR